MSLKLGPHQAIRERDQRLLALLYGVLRALGLTAAFLAFGHASANAATVAGSRCPKVGASLSVSGRSYSCRQQVVKKKRVLVWVQAATPSTVPVVAPSVLPTTAVQFTTTLPPTTTVLVRSTRPNKLYFEVDHSLYLRFLRLYFPVALWTDENLGELGNSSCAYYRDNPFVGGKLPLSPNIKRAVVQYSATLDLRKRFPTVTEGQGTAVAIAAATWLCPGWAEDAGIDPNIVD